MHAHAHIATDDSEPTLNVHISNLFDPSNFDVGQTQRCRWGLTTGTAWCQKNGFKWAQDISRRLWSTVQIREHHTTTQIHTHVGLMYYFKTLKIDTSIPAVWFRLYIFRTPKSYEFIAVWWGHVLKWPPLRVDGRFCPANRFMESPQKYRQNAGVLEIM